MSRLSELRWLVERKAPLQSRRFVRSTLRYPFRVLR